MKLYVINLDRSSERLQRLEQLFAALSLSFTRVKAIDAHDLTHDDIIKISQKSQWAEPLTKGEIACFLSHRRALQLIAQGNDTYGAIFEDDVDLADEAAYFLKNDQWIKQHFKADNNSCDLIKLETSGKKVWLGEKQALINHETYNYVGSDFFLERLKSTHIMAAAYIVSKFAAQKLLVEMERVSAPFDHWLFNFDYGIIKQLQAFQLDPAVAVQAHLPSTLQAERTLLTKNKQQKRTKLQTFKRELYRILKRSKIGLWGIGVNLTTKNQWKRVAFASKKLKKKLKH